jgi:beta-xylosidase
VTPPKTDPNWKEQAPLKTIGKRFVVTVILFSLVACGDTGRTAGNLSVPDGSEPDTAQGPTGACYADGGLRYSENPFTTRFVADPAAHVFNGRVYVYDTDDQSNGGTYWNSTVWHAFSSDNLVDWTDEGTVLTLQAFGYASGKWAAWAPDVVSKDGKYYFFAPIDRWQIGVAVSDSPTGPFVDAIGGPLIQKDRDVNAGDEPIDPAVLIDDDGQAYLYFGTRVPKVVKLTADLLHMDGPILDLSVSASVSGISYAEAPWMGKHNGTYYFSYSTGWPGQIAYATSASPLGPFVYQGIVLDYDGISTNHASVVEDFKGKSYLFYHNGKLPGGGDYRRSINVDELHYDTSGAITQVVQTTQGVACVP